MTAEEESWTLNRALERWTQTSIQGFLQVQQHVRKSNIHEAHRCDKHTHRREEHLRHRPHMLHESAPDAFAMLSNPSNCSWCNIQKSEFYIHCCSTCHAFPRSHVNLDIAPHTLFIHAFGCARPCRRRTRRLTGHDSRLSAHLCAPPTMFKAAGTDVSGSVSPARLWRGTCSAYHKRRLEGLCQRAGASIANDVGIEVQFGDGDVGLVLKQPWRINSQPAVEHH